MTSISFQDKFSVWSQQKAKAARDLGRLSKEIIAVEIPGKKGEVKRFDQDEFIKPDTTVEALAKLKTSFRKDGTVTAGNASGLNDGAAALLLASTDAVKKYKLKPLAKIISSAVFGVEPRTRNETLNLKPNYAFSMTTAYPCPTPMHIVTKAYLEPTSTFSPVLGLRPKRGGR